VFVKRSADCREFTANDGCRIQELLHPKNDHVELPWSLAIATVETGEKTWRHMLRQSEVYFILSGQGCMHVGNETGEVKEGDVIYIPPQSVQWIENTGDQKLQFAAIVSPPWQAEDDIRITD
jgi:mannose-6-phosphate isomerase-like protein (cupin superfamily)